MTSDVNGKRRNSKCCQVTTAEDVARRELMLTQNNVNPSLAQVRQVMIYVMLFFFTKRDYQIQPHCYLLLFSHIKKKSKSLLFSSIIAYYSFLHGVPSSLLYKNLSFSFYLAHPCQRRPKVTNASFLSLSINNLPLMVGYQLPEDGRL